MKHGDMSMDEISLLSLFDHFLLMRGKRNAWKANILKHCKHCQPSQM